MCVCVGCFEFIDAIREYLVCGTFTPKLDFLVPDYLRNHIDEALLTGWKTAENVLL